MVHGAVPGFWHVVTSIGSTGVQLPALATALIGLWCSGQQNALRIWLPGFVLMVLLTLLSKILFMGWGIGLATFDFTGISGHALLATAGMPLVFALAFSRHRNPSFIVLGLGWLIGAIVAFSRVVLGAHSTSEVVLACLLGILLTFNTVRAISWGAQMSVRVRMAPLLVLLIFCTTASNLVPSHQMEIRLALWLSGQAKPFERIHLHQSQL